MMTSIVSRPLVLLGLLAMQGCTQPIVRSQDRVPASPMTADSALACGVLRHDDVSRIAGAKVLSSAPSSSGNGWCRFNLENGEWFSLSLMRWPDTRMYTSAVCDDYQNGPTWGAKIYHPSCSAQAGPLLANVQSSQYFGMSKDKMKLLLDAAVAQLAQSAGSKVLGKQ
ncbi:hypothetical protein ACQ859_25140 [Roseateles chitinivorans]|uniref:hypothetical protein n=1 Tax=Roseateles chitinivorans TaxID=2917965 RepID=UPI003D6650F3